MCMLNVSCNALHTHVLKINNLKQVNNKYVNTNKQNQVISVRQKNIQTNDLNC